MLNENPIQKQIRKLEMISNSYSNEKKIVKTNRMFARKTIIKWVVRHLILVNRMSSLRFISEKSQNFSPIILGSAWLCHMEKCCANEVIKSLKCHQKSQSMPNNNNNKSLWHGFQFMYALNVLFAYLYMYFAYWNRIPITFRSRILRFFTQANASFR